MARIDLSCRREGWNWEKLRFWNPPGKAEIVLSCRRELNFMDFWKNMKNMKMTRIVLSCRLERWDWEQIRFWNQPGKAKIMLSCRREFNFMDFTNNIKRPFHQSPSPFGADFRLILVSILEPIWGPKSTQNRSPFLKCFLMTFRTTFSSFVVIYLITWEVKKQCEVDREAMLCNSERHWKTMYFTMKMKGRKRRGCLKNKQERQLDSPKNQSERQAMLKTISGSIWDPFWVHFGTQNGSKIASNLSRKSRPPKVDQKWPKKQNSDIWRLYNWDPGPTGGVRGFN